MRLRQDCAKLHAGLEWRIGFIASQQEEAANRIEELEHRLGEAYQAFGQIAFDADIFDTPSAIALLDLLSKD